MTFIADILLAAGALAAAFYCMVLSRRLRRFADLDNGVGGAVAVLSVQVDDMTRPIRQAETSAAASAARLDELTERSEDAARRLELMLAAMHDLPLPEPTPPPHPATADLAAPAPQPEPEAKARREPPLTA